MTGPRGQVLDVRGRGLDEVKENLKLNTRKLNPNTRFLNTKEPSTLDELVKDQN